MKEPNEGFSGREWCDSGWSGTKQSNLFSSKLTVSRFMQGLCQVKDGEQREQVISFRSLVFLGGAKSGSARLGYRV